MPDSLLPLREIRRLGLAEIPVVIAKGWSKTKRQAYAIIDNKIALNSGWDDELLKVEFVGSPSYLAGRKRPKTPQDLMNHNCLNLQLPTHGGSL